MLTFLDVGGDDYEEGVAQIKFKLFLKAPVGHYYYQLVQLFFMITTM